ncbi:MAG: phosphoribosyltransferase family protein [Cyclobacteriaceae bacterium]
MPVTEESLILTKKAVNQKIRRMAYEIYENNFGDKVIVLAGIYDRGYELAQKIKKELEKISSLEVRLVKITIDKEKPLKEEAALDCQYADLKGKSVIVIDDVLNTGRTMAHSFKAFLKAEIKKMEAAALVDRSHKLYPINATYKGYELSTTLNEHVEVRLKGEAQGVYLLG